MSQSPSVPETVSSFKAGSRVRATDPDTNKQRLGTVLEIDPLAGYVRVCFDLKWMHDWLSVNKVEVL